MPMAETMASLQVVHNEPEPIPSAMKEANQELCPTFGPHSNTQFTNFNFEKEVEHLPFNLNLGDVPLNKDHQAKFTASIYNKQEVLSLHDKDLDYCNHLTHTIPTSLCIFPTWQIWGNFRERCMNS